MDSKMLEILQKVQQGVLNAQDAVGEIVKNTRKPPRFKVAEKSGWCSVYFDKLRRPVTLPSSLWLELLDPANLETFRKFLQENKDKFKNKE